jgi:hypothetical protein
MGSWERQIHDVAATRSDCHANRHNTQPTVHTPKLISLKKSRTTMKKDGTNPQRRSILFTLGAGLASLAGCADSTDDESDQIDDEGEDGDDETDDNDDSGEDADLGEDDDSDENEETEDDPDEDEETEDDPDEDDEETADEPDEDGPDEDDEVDGDSDADEEDDDGLAELNITDEELEDADEGSVLHVTVENEGEGREEVVTVRVRVYDEDGEEIDTYWSASRDIAGGDEEHFEIEIPLDSDEISEYEAAVTGSGGA